MKNILKLISGAFLFAMVFSSCKKDENQVMFEGGTNPVLTASSTNALVLKKEDKDKVAVVLTWTNPDYKFNTGVSSQDVTYILQVDTTGKNFTSGNLQEKSIANDLALTLTVKDVNTFLGKLELKAGVQYNVEMRIKASLTGGTVPLYSNVIKIKYTPYLDFAVEPPGTDAGGYLDAGLWVIGDCFGSPNWSNPLPSPQDVNHKFTRVDLLHYELTIAFVSTGNYKMIQTQGVWGTQYHAIAPPADGLSGEFEKRDADPGFVSPGAGTYKIEVNFQTGKYKLTKI
ncbi:MAG: SusE domain-containing protein [Chitinophagaceae bacterium]